MRYADKNKTYPTTFRSKRPALDMIAEISEHDNRTKSKTIEYIVMRFYNEIFMKERRN